MNPLFADTETTGTGPEDRLCQLCFRLDHLERNELYRPPLPIGVGAMAVHHITNEMVETSPTFIGSPTHTLLGDIQGSVVFVAHNAPFDLGMLRREGLCFPRFIDTLKVSRFLDSEGVLESHKLQYLRYHYGLRIDAQAHDAMGDVKVLVEVFRKLREDLESLESLDEPQALDRMLDISMSPLLVRRFNFGKHKGKTVEEVAGRDRGYLAWLKREKLLAPDGEEDWFHTFKHYGI